MSPRSKSLLKAAEAASIFAKYLPSCARANASAEVFPVPFAASIELCWHLLCQTDTVFAVQLCQCLVAFLRSQACVAINSVDLTLDIPVPRQNVGVAKLFSVKNASHAAREPLFDCCNALRRLVVLNLKLIGGRVETTVVLLV